MEPEIVLLFGVALGSAVISFGRHAVQRWRRRREVRGEWRRAAGELGVRVVSVAGFVDAGIRGGVDGARVEVDFPDRGLGKSRVISTRFVVAHPRIVPALGVYQDGLAGRMETAVGFQRIETGHRSFDRELLVGGPEALLLAVLDDPMRAELRILVGQQGGRVAGGRLSVQFDSLFESSSRIVREVRRLTSLAARLALPVSEIPLRLQANARTDRLVGVRRRNLEVLIRQFAGSPVADETCRLIVQEEADPGMRLIAARRLGKAGLGALEQVAMDAAAPEEVRVAALKHLLASLPAERVLPALDGAAEGPPGPLRTAALRALLPLREENPDWLIRHVPELDGPSSARAAGALVRLQDGRAEPALISILAHADAGARLAAAAALGAVGTRDAVEPLRRAAEAGPMLFGGELRAAATAAIKSIQARLGEAGAVGRLSLSESAAGAGALSVSNEEGALSIAEGVGSPNGVDSRAATPAGEAPCAGPALVEKPGRGVGTGTAESGPCRNL